MISVEKACKPGCDHCCQSAGVTLYSIDEGVKIVDYCRIKGKEDLLRECVSQYATTQHFTTGGDFVDYEKPCPFLVEHKCAVYEVWPTACQEWVSPSAEACASFNTDLPPSWEWLARYNTEQLDLRLAPLLERDDRACADIRTVVIAAMRCDTPSRPDMMLVDDFSYGEWMDDLRAKYINWRV